jgi:hypothetical protein
MTTASPLSGVECPQPPLAFHVAALAQLPLALAVKVQMSVDEDVYRNGVGAVPHPPVEAALMGFCPTRYGEYVKATDSVLPVNVSVPFVNVPKLLPSLNVAVAAMSNVPPLLASVHEVEATRRFPDEGQPDQESVRTLEV